MALKRKSQVSIFSYYADPRSVPCHALEQNGASPSRRRSERSSLTGSDRRDKEAGVRVPAGAVSVDRRVDGVAAWPTAGAVRARRCADGVAVSPSVRAVSSEWRDDGVAAGRAELGRDSFWWRLTERRVVGRDSQPFGRVRQRASAVWPSAHRSGSQSPDVVCSARPFPPAFESVTLDYPVAVSLSWLRLGRTK